MHFQHREISERAFKVYGEPLENVTEFRYLGRVLTAGDDDWLAVVGNLVKARNIWRRLSQILIWEEVDPKLSGYFYKAVAKEVLLLEAEMCVLTPMMDRALDRFQHRFARRITRRQPIRWGYGNWDYPTFEEVMG